MGTNVLCVVSRWLSKCHGINMSWLEGKRAPGKKKKKKQITIFSLIHDAFVLFLDVLVGTLPGACLLLVLPRGHELFSFSLDFVFICLFF